jgi:Fe-S-cluster containining protein
VAVEETLRKINAQGKLHRIVRERLPALVGSAEPTGRKLVRLRQIADAAAAAIAPFTPCGKGCSACCHNPAIISELEAMAVAESIGATAATPRRIFDAGAGVPCAFLKGGVCSIYAHRPVVCRVQHSIEDSPAGCDAGRQPASVDLTEIHLGERRILGRMMIYADIREFFPPA